MEWVCWAIIAVPAGVLIGHGLWVLVARIMGFQVQTTKTIGSPALAVCPQCGHAALSAQGICGYCRWSSHPAPIAGGEAEDLNRTSGHLARLVRDGLIDTEAYDRVIAAIRREQRRLAAQGILGLAPLPPIATGPPPLPVLPLAVAQAGLAIAPGADASRSFPARVEPPPIPHEAHAPPPLPGSVQPPEAVVPAAAPAPPRSISEMFASFMEENNIRWGELVGGLLIIGCSTALVASFWAGITQRPWLQFSVFTAVTASLFGLGLYSEHRWKLPTTSRGILLIATLLVPLNFLAFAALSAGVFPGALTFAAEIVAIALFTFFLWQSAKVIAPVWPELLTLGVCILSASLLLLGCVDVKLLPPGRLILLATLPLAAYEGISGWMLARARRWRAIHSHGASAIFLLLGVLTFATAPALGLVIYRSADAAGTLRSLALLISLSGLPALASGMFLWSRVTGKRLANLRAAGTAVAVIGAMVLVAGIAIAWPDPYEMLPVALCDFAALTAIALLWRVPAAHWLALPCGVIAWLTAFHIFRGDVTRAAPVEQLAHALLAPISGTALAPLAILLAGTWKLLSRRRPPDAKVYAWIGLATSAASIALISWTGFAQAPDPNGATWVYAVYAALAFVLAWQSNRQALALAAWILLTVALAQAFISHQLTTAPWPEALLTAATLAALAVLVAARFPSRSAGILALPALGLAVIASAAAVIIVCAGLSYAGAGRASFDVCWAAVLFLAVAVVEETAALFVAGQAMLAGAAALLVISRVASYAWFAQSAAPLLEPWTIHAVSVALAIVCLFWKLLRITFRFVRVVSSAEVFESTLAGGLFVAAFALAFYAVIPALAAEFLPQRSFELAAGQLYAIGPGLWLLVGLLAAIFAVARFESSRPLPLVMFMATVWIVCPLLAARTAGLGAAASALRWLCAGYFFLGSIPIWLRHFHFHPDKPDRAPRLTPDSTFTLCARATLLVLGAAPIFALTLWPTMLTLTGGVTPAPLPSSIFGQLGVTISYAVPLLIVAIVLVGDAIVERSEAHAFAASIVFCFTFTIGYVMGRAVARHPLDGHDGVRLLQINSLAMAGFALAWLAARELLRRLGYEPGEIQRTLKLQVEIALVFSGIFLVPSSACLALAPTWAATFVGTAGGPWGLAALLATVAAAVASGALLRDQLTVKALALGALALAAMAGLSFVHHWPRRPWDAFHTLLASNGLTAWAVVAFGWWIVRRARTGSILSDAAGAPHPIPPLAASQASQQPQRQPALAPTLAQHDSNPPPMEPRAEVLSYQRADAGAIQLPVYFGGENAQQATIRAAFSISVLVVALAVRALFGDPAAPWWSMGAAAAIALLCVTIAVWATIPAALNAAAALLNFAAATWFFHRGWSAGWSGLDFLASQIIAAALPAVAWLIVELHVFRPRPAIARGYLPVHNFLAIVSTALALIVTKWIVLTALVGGAARYNSHLAAAALLADAALLVACLWDQRTRFVLAGLYALGAAGLAFTLVHAGVPTAWLPWTLVTACAAYALLTAVLFWQGDRLGRIAIRLGLPGFRQFAEFWLPPVNVAWAVVTMAAAFYADGYPAPPGAQMTVASAALLQVVALGLLAGRSRWPLVRPAALWTLATSATLWGWAWLPAAAHDSLHRWAICFIVTAWLSNGLALLLPRLLKADNPWRGAAVRTAEAMLAPAALLALARTLVAEIAGVMDHVPTYAGGVAIAVLLTIIASCALALLTALRRDNQLTDGKRMGWVYAAEALLAIALVHLRLTEPQLFGGLVRPYWPLIIMAIAFIGSGAAEMFRRQGRHILSQPLERTGLFLPLLPVIGWWLDPATVLGFGQILLVVAAYYAILAATRRSLGLAALAALAANGAVWDTLAHSSSLGFFRHPQLWLIPAALSAIAGAHLNRERLSHERLSTIRYACLLLIYVSSTADVFLNGVDRAPWLPLVLAAFSVAGVLLGILLRIRAFLFLGMGFLLLSLVTMIWFASSQLHWTWIWYVAGILLGAVIIAMFALFEKKREQMLALLEGLKQWE